MSKRKNRDKKDDEQELQQELLKNRENPPRFFKNNVDGLNLQQIIVNLSKTHYEVIEEVVQQLGWTVQTSMKSEKWDIMWTDWHIEAHDLFRLNDHQKISHYPAIYVLAKKNFLGRGLMKMNKIFPLQYNFFPFTWSIPSDTGQFLRYDNLIKTNQKKIYIFKPEASSQGKGILLFTKFEELEGKTGIVQVYMNNPMLVDNLKFDMRIYVLIYGCDSMRIYIYEEGLARFATSNYEKAKKKNLKDNFVHLTNYAINKNSKNFIFNTSDRNMNIGHKRSLTSIYNLLKTRGIDIDPIKEKIDQLIVKTLLVGKPMLEHIYGLSQTDNLTNDLCFHILGFDVILDEFLEPILLQVNHTPSFATDTPLDKHIKKNLIKETLLLLNVNIETKKTKIEKMKQFGEKRFERKLVKLSQEEKIEQKKQIEKDKDEYEKYILKKYRKIYPLSNRQQYKPFQQYATKLFNEQEGMQNKETAHKSMNKKPASFQNFTSAHKIKPSKDKSSSIVKLQTSMKYILEKLPSISAKKTKMVQDQSFHLESQNKTIKFYQFNPQKLFSDVTDKLFSHTDKMKPKQQGDSLILLKKQRKNRRQGSSYMQIKKLKLSQLVNKKVSFTDFVSSSHHKSFQKTQKNRNKIKNIEFSYTRIIEQLKQAPPSSSKQQISSSYLKEQLKKLKENTKYKDFSRYENFLSTSNEIFPIKSLSLYRKKKIQ